MARRRYVSTQISLDREVDNLAQKHGDFVALLFTWMLPHSQDDATITGDPDELMYEVIPRRRDKTVDDVTEALEAMQGEGLLYWDRETKCIYYPIESYYNYQSYINTKNRRTEEHPWFNRPTPKNAEECRESPRNTVSLSLPPSLPLPPPLSLNEDAAATDEDSQPENSMPAVCEAYRKCIGDLDGPTQFQMLRHFHEEKAMPVDVMAEAFAEAKERGDFPAAYLKGILNDWANSGVLTLEKAKERRKGRGRRAPPKRATLAQAEAEELERRSGIGS